MVEAIENLTPMLRQYLEIKEQHRDAILFYRLGDFYEMFFEDAVKASEILEITLTSRNKNSENSIPLCGVPYHSAAGYVRKLIENGLKVAICEQVEDPAKAKGIVKRQVTRVVSPGLLVEDESLSSGEPNYLAAWESEGEGRWIAFLDISTGEVWCGYYEDEESALQHLLKHQVKELVEGEGDSSGALLENLKKLLPTLLVSRAKSDAADSAAAESYGEAFAQSLESVEAKPALIALHRLLGYVRETQRSVLHHLSPVHVVRKRQYLAMDARTFRHLELVSAARDAGRGGTLFWVLNQTQTAMGARRLKKWIHQPLLEIAAIARRQDAIAELLAETDKLFTLQEGLRPIQDVERMLGKLAIGTVHARDLFGLALSLKRAAALVASPALAFQSACLGEWLASYPRLDDLVAHLESRLQENCPVTVRDGGMIASGVHPELDELRNLSRDGKSYIARLEERERQRTGISSLKVRYNKVFGYYIEVTNARKEGIPEDYIRKQTLANAERFITPELKEYENKVLGAEERIKALEYELFVELRERATARLAQIRQAGETLGNLDAIASLARVARDQRYVRPVLTEEKELDLQDSRHPVLEKILPAGKFIPNDLKMGGDGGRLFLITGPNMAGKSTVMRQMALIILMAQIGSYVPASSARIGIVDQLFTRIGASDDLTQGQSTFMVEMLETAAILKSASERSFIVLDEIGRGTSTYDGMSIAWAIAEYVAQHVRCRALFATHYHELTDLAQTMDGIENYQVAVKEWNDQVLFLRKLIKGGASRSYGIEVARLAGLPDSVLTRAREVLKNLEKAENVALTQLNASKPPAPQLDLFARSESPIVEEIRALEPEALTPIEALNKIYQWKKTIDS